MQIRVAERSRLKSLEIVRKGVSGRVAVEGLKIVGSTRTLRVDGWDVRTALGLKDTWFRFKVVEPTTARKAPSKSSSASEDTTIEAPQPEPGPSPTPSPSPELSPSPEPSPSPDPTPSPAPSPSPSP